MTITSYDDLSALAKIVYVRYHAGTITEAQVNTFVTLGKITQEEADFILGN
jgi:uncharacterized XkdX family phage protein